MRILRDGDCPRLRPKDTSLASKHCPAEPRFPTGQQPSEKGTEKMKLRGAAELCGPPRQFRAQDFGTSDRSSMPRAGSVGY